LRPVLRRPLTTIRFAALIGLLAAPAVADEGRGSSAARYMPPTAALFATLRDGDEQVRALCELLESVEFTESKPYAALTANADLFRAQTMFAGLAATAGLDPWSAVAALLGRETAVGLVPTGRGRPDVMVVTIAREPQRLDRLLEAVHRFAGLSPNGAPDAQRSREIVGVRVYSLNENVHDCRVDDALLVSNSGELLRSMLEQRASAASLAASESYRNAESQVPAAAVAWGYADLARIRSVIRHGEGLPEKLPNPLAGFLFGGWWHALRNADAAVAWAVLRGRSLEIAGRLEAAVPLPETHRGFAPRGLQPLTWSADELPGFLGEVVVARGWRDLFSEREALLSLQAASDVVNVSNTLTALMGQLDFVDDVLGNVVGPARLVLARQDFGGRGYTPTPKLPGFALIAPLRTDPDLGLTQRLYSASQIALSILSMDAAQQGRPALLMDLETYQGCRILAGAYPRPGQPGASGMMMQPPARQPQRADRTTTRAASGPASEPTRPPGAPIAYNFEPCAAVVNDHYLVATDRALLRRLIDRIREGKPATATAAREQAGTTDWLALKAPELLAVLKDNREELVVNRMLEQDEPREQAERVIDALLGVLRYFDDLSLRAERREGGYHATLWISLRASPIQEP